MTDTITPAPQYTPPNITTASDPPVFVNLSMLSIPAPSLWDMRRDLISALRTVENLLELPAEKRAIRTRAERRGNGDVGIDK